VNASLIFIKTYANNGGQFILIPAPILAGIAKLSEVIQGAFCIWWNVASIR
jgi:hypothetical protein